MSLLERLQAGAAAGGTAPTPAPAPAPAAAPTNPVPGGQLTPEQLAAINNPPAGMTAADVLAAYTQGQTPAEVAPPAQAEATPEPAPAPEPVQAAAPKATALIADMPKAPSHVAPAPKASAANVTKLISACAAVGLDPAHCRDYIKLLNEYAGK